MIIADMGQWWNGLEAVNQVFYAIAGFFSLIFVWQFISSILGFSADTDIDAHVDTHIDGHVDGDVDGEIEAHSAGEAAESIAAFKILSIRAVMAFCTMFSWAGALYMDRGDTVQRSILYATLWGLAGWALIAVMIHWLKKLPESGNRNLATAVGTEATVYADIPPKGTGQIRVIISEVLSVINARNTTADGIKSGTPVKVIRAFGTGLLEVETIHQENEEEKGKEQDT